MFSQCELTFRIEIKCAIFKRIIAKRLVVSHIFKAQTNIFRIFGRSCHPLKFLPENLPCLQFASKPGSVTSRFFFGRKRLMMSCVKTLIVQSNRYMFSYTAQLG